MPLNECGYCWLEWDADVGGYDLIESDHCPDHGILFDGFEVEDEDAMLEDQIHDQGRGE